MTTEEVLEKPSEEAVAEKTEKALIKIKPKLSANVVRLLKLKARLDAKRPYFVRCESWRNWV
ncbi:hypothetical protein KEJ25_07270, partial [Candidatus Bathyarchaeota archaeon]|nr:hypothetical protein [Candidatus Bathyarchaeota archaeon]